MSTKTSTLGAAGSSAVAAMASPTPSSAIGASTQSVPIPPLNIKKELPSDEIKEFAENTMNELLGWYGFDGVDRLDLSAKSSRLLQPAATAAGLAIAPHHHMEKRCSRSRVTTLLQLQQQSEHFKNFTNNNNSINNNNICNNNNISSSSSLSNNHKKKGLHSNNYRDVGNSALGGILGGGGGGGGSGAGGNEMTNSDHDTRSSREDDSKSPHSAGKTTMDEKIDFLNCCWCRRPVPENAPEFLTTSDGPRYCSESCFTQSRRASFKKAKTCDWCKHVRHAVSYVDFQDGASQLQFCSDKCLNQYKMQIFCKETQAHLDMNPHLRDQGLEAVAAGNGAGLITPELWLRNCRSRSASPASTVSVSPGPSVVSAAAGPSTVPPAMPGSMMREASPTVTPSNCSAGGQLAAATTATSSSTISPPVTALQQQQHKPLISVAPASKLMMAKSPNLMQHHQRPSPRPNRKKRPLRACVGNAEMGGALKAGHPCSSTPRPDLSSQSGLMVAKPKSMLLQAASSGSHLMRTSPAHMTTTAGGGGGSQLQTKSTPSSLSQFVGSSVQDLHMSVPPLSPMDPPPPLGHHPLPHLHAHPHSHQHPHPLALPHRPPGYFAAPPTGPPPPLAHTPNHQMPPGGGGGFPPRSPFMPNHGAPSGMHPRFFGGFGAGMHQAAQLPPPLPPHLLPPPPSFESGGMWGAAPPVTVLVPYPVIIPLPVPIPIPLPVLSFYKAYLSPEERARFEESERRRRFSGAEPSVAPKTETLHDDTQDADEAEMSGSSGGSIVVVEEQPLDFTKTKDYNNTATEEQLLDVSEETSPPVHSPAEEDASLDPGDGHTSASVTPAPMTDDGTNSPEYGIVNTSVPADHAQDSTETTADTSAMGAFDEARQQLPKFKITRLQAKRSLVQSKEAECSRPLRKRKRIIDCDFQRIVLKEGGDAAESSSVDTVDMSSTRRSPMCADSGHRASTSRNMK